MLGVLRGFAPFILFAVLVGRVGTTTLLLIAAASSLISVVLDARHGETPKFLEWATLALFVALAAYVRFADPALPLFAARMTVEWGLAAIAIGSVLANAPFTLQYARQQVPRHYWDHPRFIAVNRTISLVWGLSFALQACISIAAVRFPELPPTLPVALNLASTVAAAAYTMWFSARARARAAAVQLATNDGKIA